MRSHVTCVHADILCLSRGVAHGMTTHKGCLPLLLDTRFVLACCFAKIHNETYGPTTPSTLQLKPNNWGIWVVHWNSSHCQAMAGRLKEINWNWHGWWDLQHSQQFIDCHLRHQRVFELTPCWHWSLLGNLGHFESNVLVCKSIAEGHEPRSEKCGCGISWCWILFSPEIARFILMCIPSRLPLVESSQLSASTCNINSFGTKEMVEVVPDEDAPVTSSPSFTV